MATGSTLSPRSLDLSKTQPIPVVSDRERLEAYRASQAADAREPLLPPIKPRTTSAFNVATPRTRSKTLVEVACVGGAK